MKAQRWILAKHFEGVPKDSDLKLVEEELPSLNNGDVLLEALFLSLDPYMRIFSSALPIGSVMIGEQVARVVDSKNAKYKKGQLYLANAGWQSRFIVNPDKESERITLEPTVETGSHSPSLNISVLGMPGKTAYIGLVKLCDPKPGETVYVNSAAGMVGSLAGQIAKIKGCRVIGSAGSDDKVKWLTSELGFDYAFNYKTRDWKEALKEAAPNGIDCFYDNVSDAISTGVYLDFMNTKGRVTQCGCISQANESTLPTGPLIFGTILSKQLRVQGLHVYSHAADFQSLLVNMKQWLDEGKLKYHEEIVEGFENMRHAFYGLLSGKYTGKVIVKATV